jgi:hypothetical protein
MDFDLLMSLLPFIFWMVIAVPPSIRLLRRTGIHPAIAAFNVVPAFGAVIILFIVAYSRWPKSEGGA